MMMTVMRVTISRRDTADTTITDELLSLHVSVPLGTTITSKSLSLLVSISPGTGVEVGHVVESSEVRNIHQIQSMTKVVLH